MIAGFCLAVVDYDMLCVVLEYIILYISKYTGQVVALTHSGPVWEEPVITRIANKHLAISSIAMLIYLMVPFPVVISFTSGGTLG